MSATDSQVTDVFGGLAAKAEALLEQKGLDPSAESTPVSPTVPSSAPAPVQAQAEQPPADSSAQPAQTPEPLQLSPETLVRIKVDGQEQVVRYGDFQNDLAGTATFTRRQQTLAQQRRELEQYVAQREAELIQAAQWIQQQAQAAQQQGDPVQRLVQALQPQAQPQPKNPNEIVTFGEVQRLLQEQGQQSEAKLTEAQHRLLQEQQQLVAQAQQDAFIAQERTRFSKSMSSLMETEDGRLLAELNPQAEKLIRFETMQMGPQDTDQAMEFAQKMAKEWADKVRGKFIQQQKVDAVAAARTKMEPPSGGSAPSPQSSTKAPQSFLKKDGTVDLVGMRERAMAILESI